MPGSQCLDAKRQQFVVQFSCLPTPLGIVVGHCQKMHLLQRLRTLQSGIDPSHLQCLLLQGQRLLLLSEKPERPSQIPHGLADLLGIGRRPFLPPFQDLPLQCHGLRAAIGKIITPPQVGQRRDIIPSIRSRMFTIIIPHSFLQRNGLRHLTEGGIGTAQGGLHFRPAGGMAGQTGVNDSGRAVQRLRHSNTCRIVGRVRAAQHVIEHFQITLRIGAGHFLFISFPRHLTQLVRQGLLRPDGTERQQGTHDRSGHQQQGNRGRHTQRNLVTAGKFPQTMSGTRRSGADGFVGEEMLDIQREGIGRFVTARAILVDGLHDDPVQIRFHQMTQLVRLHVPRRRNRRALVTRDRAESRRGPGRLNLANDPAHLIVSSRDQRLGIEWRAAGQQFIQENTQRINVAPGINVQSTERRLLRAHVNRGSNELFEPGGKRFVCKPVLGGFGDTEIDDLGHGLHAVERNHDIRGFDIAVDDALLVRVIDG